MKRLDIITNVGYIQETLEHSECKGLNKEQTALEIKKIIDEVVKLVSKNESLHLVVESPQDAFDRGYTAGLNTGKKLVK